MAWRKPVVDERTFAGEVKWVPLSVSTVWLPVGTALMSARRKSPATLRVAFSCSSKGEPGGAIDGDQESEPALGGMDLGEVDAEEAGRVGLEPASGRGAALDFEQPGDVVSLEAAVQRRPGRMRDGGLQGIRAVVQRQQGMPTKGDDDGLVLDAEHGGPRLFGARRQVVDELRCVYLAMVFWLTPWRLARALRLS